MKWKERASIGLIRIDHFEDYTIRVYSDRLAIYKLDPAYIMSWEDLQRVKQHVVGDRICVEVYPSEASVVNIRNTRHLWFGDNVDILFKTLDHPEFRKE